MGSQQEVRGDGRSIRLAGYLLPLPLGPSVYHQEDLPFR